MAQTADAVDMTTYQFEIDDDEWTEWKLTVPRSKALDERIRELLRADKEGRVQERDQAESEKRSVSDERTREREPEPGTTDKPTVDDAVSAVVERISDGWEDTDDRLEQRRVAARAVLQHAVDTGDAVGKADAIENYRDEFNVEGQNEETWWRKNIRPVLKAVGEYSQSLKGYVVEEADLDEFLGGE